MDQNKLAIGNALFTSLEVVIHVLESHKELHGVVTLVARDKNLTVCSLCLHKCSKVSTLLLCINLPDQHDVSEGVTLPIITHCVPTSLVMDDAHLGVTLTRPLDPKVEGSFFITQICIGINQLAHACSSLLNEVSLRKKKTKKKTLFGLCSLYRRAPRLASDL